MNATVEKQNSPVADIGNVPLNAQEYFEARVTAAADAGRAYIAKRTQDTPELRRLVTTIADRIDGGILADTFNAGAATAMGMEAFDQVMRIVFGALAAMNDAAIGVQKVH